MNFSGIVLNGGSSSRMGRDKAEILYKGRRLIDIAIESLIAAEVKDVVIVGGEKRSTHWKRIFNIVKIYSQMKALLAV